MLLGYGAKNCWCFKDWMQVNLELDGSVPSDISLNLPAATAMCFKGANASGKTNGLKVLAFIKHFADNAESENGNRNRTGKRAELKNQRANVGDNERWQRADDIEHKS